MPILTIQRQLRQLGRIRTGQQVPAGRDGKTRPSKLDTFRLTSGDRELIDHAAAVYEGIPTPWRQGWEVVTNATALDIIIPPGQMVSQWFELWSAGGCLRRCDGITERLTAQPCLCPVDPEERRTAAAGDTPTACKPTTRLSVMLPALPDLGVWMLESHGYYAAIELAGAADVLVAATARGQLIPARLVLEQREKKQPGQPLHRYAVPVIRFAGTAAADLALTDAARPALPGGRAGVPLLPSATLPAASTLRAPTGPPELTRDELLQAIDDDGFPLDWAVERAEAIYGEGTDLTPAQRGELLWTLRAEAAQ